MNGSYSLSAVERETIIILNDGEDYVSVYTCRPKDLRYMQKLAGKYPEEVRQISPNEWYVPFRWNRMPVPPKKQNLTDEQKAALTKRLHPNFKAAGAEQEDA
jgi:hypothetical protein